MKTDFKEGREQGSVGLNRLSTYKQWKNLNNTKERRDEYSILRFIHKDSQGNAVLKYKTTNIPSSVVRNVIGVNLNKKQMYLIETIFEKLKKKFNGKQLINEVYRQALNYDIKFEGFDITQLIMNTKLDSTSVKTIFLNKQNPFYNAVLNKYWSTLASINYSYIKNEKEVQVYDLKNFRDYYNPERRQDFIYPETLKTGDILIYKNNNDATYSVNSLNKLVKNYITYEEGEYFYIYIEGKGFVGVNLGDDNKRNTQDDRNEFNYNYYINNGLELYPLSINPGNKELEIANLQTLFGKDYYVILRPSLCFNFQ